MVKLRWASVMDWARLHPFKLGTDYVHFVTSIFLRHFVVYTLNTTPRTLHAFAARAVCSIDCRLFDEHSTQGCQTYDISGTNTRF